MSSDKVDIEISFTALRYAALAAAKHCRTQPDEEELKRCLHDRLDVLAPVIGADAGNLVLAAARGDVELVRADDAKQARYAAERAEAAAKREAELAMVNEGGNDAG